MSNNYTFAMIRYLMHHYSFWRDYFQFFFTSQSIVKANFYILTAGGLESLYVLTLKPEMSITNSCCSFSFLSRELDLKKPIYETTCTYGHFKPGFTWEVPKKLKF